MALKITYKIFHIEEQNVLIAYEAHYGGQDSSTKEALQTLRYHSEHDSLELAELALSELCGNFTILPVYSIS